MNNKGQTLIIFVLILPVLLLFIAFFIDLSIVSVNKNKIDGVVRDNLEIILNDDIKDENKIKDVFKINKVDVNKIEIIDNKIKISIKQRIDSLFGNLLKFSVYTIKKNYVGNYDNKRIEVVGEL